MKILVCAYVAVFIAWIGFIVIVESDKTLDNKRKRR